MATLTGVSLTALTGPLAGQRLALPGTGLVIGRQEADLTLPDEQVSRRHAALRPVPGGVEIADLGSLNGTWVDGARIAAPVVVGDGARVKVGTTTLVLNLGPDDRVGATPAAPPPTPFAPTPPARTRRPAAVATRLWLPAALSFAAILATAAALLVYFSVR